jgi:membrane protein DedA with SNARE-associated domain
VGGYWIGNSGGLQFLTKHGRFLGITQKRISRARKFFTEHGPKAVFFARFIAILRIFAGLLAGVTKMRFGTFLLWNALGALAWSILFGALGYVFGNNLPRLEHLVGRTSLIAFVVVVFAAIIVWHHRGSRAKLKGSA